MKFNIITLGCKVNTYESNYMKESLFNSDFSFCDNLSLCDVIIINTCTVTDTADKKCLKTVRRVKRENPNAIIVVCGCSSQYNASVYRDIGVDIILGNVSKSNIVDLINNYNKTKQKYEQITSNRNLPFENMTITNFEHIRAFIKIQDGCDNFCSYCVIPFVRGSARSKEYSTILSEAKTLSENGFKEIVLTGIHTGSYNDNGKDLCDLISDLSKIESIDRIRLSSVEITELNDKFMNLLKNNSKLCNHLHIPLQSGSDKILKLMNRKYDTKYFENKINMIRSIRPDISITTDVIVGHNYEDDIEFINSYNFCKRINFAKVHVFPYSKRNGTKTSIMDGNVEEHIKSKRVKELILLSDKLENDYYNKFMGKQMDVLIETVAENESTGHTSNYLKVTINKKLEKGQLYSEVIK